MEYSKISFPGLGLEFNPDRSLQIGPLSIYFYGLIIAIGLGLAAVYGLRRCKQFGLKQDDVIDGALMIIPFAVLCARLYYCIFKWDMYKDDLLSIFYIWEGGLAIYGGVLGAILGIIVFAKVKKLSLPAILDIVALGFLIGQSIGRWGNFFNREAFGTETTGFLRMGLYKMVTEDGKIVGSTTMHYFHPTFLYESLWNAVGFVALHFLSKKRQYDGQIALGYAAWYGLGRAMIEGLRTDSLYLGSFRVSQLLALCSFIVGTGVLIALAFYKHDKEKLYVNRVAALEATAAETTEEKEEKEEKEEPEQE